MKTEPTKKMPDVLRFITHYNLVKSFRIKGEFYKKGKKFDRKRYISLMNQLKSADCQNGGATINKKPRIRRLIEVFKTKEY